MSNVENQGPSDDELLNEVLSEETADTPAVTEQSEQVEEPAAEAAGETKAAATETQGEQPAVDDNAPQVPSWRLREINEEKRALAAELERLKAEVANARRAPQQQPQQEQQPPKAERPDPLLDPEGYAKAVREDIRNELLADRREESLQRALEEKPEEFKAAYAAAQQSNDAGLKARMQAARDPGKELLKWHKEQRVKAEVGDDLDGYIEKKVQERLAAQTQQPNGQTQQNNGRPKVALPPSLNGASRANTTLKSNVEDVPDDELFRQIAG